MPFLIEPVRPLYRHLATIGPAAMLVLAVAGTGCVHYVAHPIDSAGSAAALSGRRLAAGTWTLERLTREAVQSQPGVLLARAQYETAQAAIRTAGERPNPTVALLPQVVTPWSLILGTYSVDFDWTVETAGKRSRRLAVARAGGRAAAARVIEATWKARAAVRKAFLELYAAEERAKLLTEAVARQDELLKLLESRVQAGAESRATTAQPRLLQVQLRLQSSEADKAAGAARAALAEALGMGTNGLSDAKFAFGAFEKIRSAASAANRRAALTHRADVLAALADYAAAESTLRLEVAKQYPDIHLNPGYQLDAGENKWALGVGLTLPILNQNRGPIAEAEAKRKEAAAKFNVVQAGVLADCDRATAAVNAAKAKLAMADELLAGQEKVLGSEQRLVASGEGDKLSLLSAQVERATTLTVRLDALVEWQTALGALEEATQTPLEP